MVVVVGAGAAGLMAAIFAARGGKRVTVVERTEDGGRKILISGGGRCNVLPSMIDPSRFVTDSSRRILNRLLESWPVGDQRRFFEDDLGIRLKLEPETGKLFPVSDRAREVRDRLVGEARRLGVTFRFGTRVDDAVPVPNGWSVRTGDGETLSAGRVVLTTGGLSVPKTGSDGIGLTIAGRLGHRINPTYPALTPLTADPPVHGGLSGLSLRVSATGTWGRRKAHTAGGFLFTHRGYSGPAVLDVSHLAVRSRIAGERAELRVQWGDLAAAGWDDRLKTQSRRSVLGVIRDELPARLAERLLNEAGVPPETTLAQLPKAARRALVEVLAGYLLPWTGDEGYQKAEVTGGGVALEELDPMTLESRRQPGLFLAGEILDAFGPIGGYNFAWAWATGRLAGRAG